MLKEKLLWRLVLEDGYLKKRSRTWVEVVGCLVVLVAVGAFLWLGLAADL